MIRQCRQAQRPRSSSSSACDQLVPPSSETSTRATCRSPPGERVAAHLDRAGRDRLAVGRGQHVGVERDQAERHPRARPRRPVLGQQPVGDVLEVALPGPRAHLDPLEPLDAARADVAGHDHAQRRAVDGRERLAVHLPGEQDLGPAGLLERDRAAEALRRAWPPGRRRRRRSRRARPARAGRRARARRRARRPSTSPCRSRPDPTAPRRGCRGSRSAPRAGCPRTAAWPSPRAPGTPRAASSSERSSSRSTSPCTRSRHAAGSASGTAPCART